MFRFKSKLFPSPDTVSKSIFLFISQNEHLLIPAINKALTWSLTLNCVYKHYVILFRSLTWEYFLIFGSFSHERINPSLSHIWNKMGNEIFQFPSHFRTGTSVKSAYNHQQFYVQQNRPRKDINVKPFLT